MSTLESRQECQRLLNLHPMFLECKASRIDRGAEVVEIALINSDGSALLEELVRPKQEIDPEMAKVHGITNKIAQIAPPWTEIWQPVKTLLQGRIVGVFDLDSRLEWIRQSNANHYLRWEFNQADFFCIQKFHAEYHHEWDRSTNNFRRFGLEEAAELVGLPSEPQASHRRALEDARLARAILLVMAGWKVN